MCNEYELVTDLFGDLVWIKIRGRSNAPYKKHVHPDYQAAVVRREGSENVLDVMRWGFPPDPRRGDGRVQTNIRSPNYKEWAPFTGVEHRALVPASAFCEWTDGIVPESGKREKRWFGLSDERPLFFFAGLWRDWTGTRGPKKAPEEGDHRLFSFLTTKANSVVAPIHAKAMPAILTTAEECEAWLTLPTKDALKLQRPLADDLLKVVAPSTA